MAKPATPPKSPKELAEKAKQKPGRGGQANPPRKGGTTNPKQNARGQKGRSGGK